jgi:hypothetical protein
MAAPTIAGSPTLRSNIAAAGYVGDSPAGVTAGEVLCATVRANSSTTVISYTNLNGWTLLENQTGANGTSSFLIKEADATDAANAGTVGYYSWTPSNNDANSVVIWRVSGADLPEDAHTSTNRASAATWTLPAVTTTGVDRLILWTVQGGTSVTWGFSAGTEFYEHVEANTRSQAGAWETQASAGDSGTRTATPPLSSAGGSSTVALAPASTGITETMRPNAALVLTNLSGAFTDIDDDPDSPGGDWLTNP